MPVQNTGKLLLLFFSPWATSPATGLSYLFFLIRQPVHYFIISLMTLCTCPVREEMMKCYICQLFFKSHVLNQPCSMCQTSVIITLLLYHHCDKGKMQSISIAFFKTHIFCILLRLQGKMFSFPFFKQLKLNFPIRSSRNQYLQDFSIILNKPTEYDKPNSKSV